jgi:hypothetical protein
MDKITFNKEELIQLLLEIQADAVHGNIRYAEDFKKLLEGLKDE